MRPSLAQSASSVSLSNGWMYFQFSSRVGLLLVLFFRLVAQGCPYILEVHVAFRLDGLFVISNCTDFQFSFRFELFFWPPLVLDGLMPEYFGICQYIIGCSAVFLHITNHSVVCRSIPVYCGMSKNSPEYSGGSRSSPEYS